MPEITNPRQSEAVQPEIVGVDPVTAAGLGVYLHGAAGQEYAADYGASGMLASELARGIAVVAAALRR